MISLQAEVTSPSNNGHIDLRRLSRELVAARPQLDATEQRLAVTLYRALVDGTPVSLEDLSDLADLDATSTASMVRQWPNVFFDEEGRVIAFGGLAIPEMSHRIEVDGRMIYTWCAWDTLFIPLVLGREIRVTSTAPGSDAPVTLRVSPAGVRDLAPSAAVLSFVRPPRFDSDVIGAFCHHVHFFPSRASGARWLSGRENGFLLSIDEGFALGRDWVDASFGAALER